MRATAVILGALAGMLIGWPAVVILAAAWLLIAWNERGRA